MIGALPALEDWSLEEPLREEQGAAAQHTLIRSAGRSSSRLPAVCCTDYKFVDAGLVAGRGARKQQ